MFGKLCWVMGRVEERKSHPNGHFLRSLWLVSGLAQLWCICSLEEKNKTSILGSFGWIGAGPLRLKVPSSPRFITIRTSCNENSMNIHTDPEPYKLHTYYTYYMALTLINTDSNSLSCLLMWYCMLISRFWLVGSLKASIAFKMLWNDQLWPKCYCWNSLLFLWCHGVGRVPLINYNNLKLKLYHYCCFLFPV